MEETRYDNSGVFVTLTFSDESLNTLSNEIKGLTGYNLDNAICKLAVRRFLERYRKKNKTSIKHWLVTEIGGKYTERIHIHGILWMIDTWNIEKLWSYGNVKLGYSMNEKVVNYIVKYLHKTDIKHKHYNSIVLTSPGIGKQFINRKTDIERAKKTDTYIGS